MNQPRFKSCYRVEVINPQTVFVLAEDRHWTLSGRTYAALTPLLTGEHSIDALVGQLASSVSPPELFVALRQLAQRGFLTESADALAPGASAFWLRMGVDEAAAQRRLAAGAVALSARGAAGEAELRAALAGSGLRLDEAGGLQVVLVDDYADPALAEQNRAALASGRPWLIARLGGASLWVGPLFTPGAGPCWECLAQRLLANRQVESYLQARLGAGQVPAVARAYLPTTVALGAQIVAAEAAKYLARGASPRLQGQLVTISPFGAQSQSHTVVRRPQCPACGQPVTAEPGPLELQSQPRRHTHDGGHRSSTPEETLARFGHHVSPITGVVSALQQLGDPGSDLIHTYAAGHNFAMVTDDLSVLRTNLRSRSGGKGMSDIQAKVSAIGEAIERYSGVYRGDEGPRRRASQDELGDAAIPLGSVLQFSPAQYAGRKEWNAALSAPYHLVPNPFDPGQELDWTPLWSLTHGRTRYLPTAYCYYGHPELHRFFCTSDANGCASGNTREEAILQGFLELVERDAIALWWYNRLRRPAADVVGLGAGDYYGRLREHYRGLGRDIWVLDVTSDLGVPSFVAVSPRLDGPSEDIIVGGGAHLDPAVAVGRALTEVNQFLPAVLQRNPDGSTRYQIDDQDAIRWFRTATLARDPYLAPDPAQPARGRADHPYSPSPDLRDEVLACLEIVRRAGLELLVLDQTRPDVGMPVVRVVVPGLRHFWRRVGPGRLYDVPVRMGWLAAPTAEADLNPESLFF